jgi:hypothetical protein
MPLVQAVERRCHLNSLPGGSREPAGNLRLPKIV